FFTIGLAIWLKGEKLSLRQGLALVLAAAGLGLILLHVDAVTTSLGLALVLVAALSWALGNMVQRATPEAPSLAFVVWASLFSVPPLLVLALVFEGAPAMVSAVSTMTPVVWAELLYQSFGNTLFGYAAWGWLLARHPAAVVSPWALLVPVFGLTASALALGEPLPPWKLAAAALVIGGLALNTLPAFRLRRDRTGAVG
ncbi:MAG: EamA family transporter, partial [Phenylobacterium sp.]|nr:EamA family transporter [Phenylobacterium sp.]